jgi:hypothetical protein
MESLFQQLEFNALALALYPMTYQNIILLVLSGRLLIKFIIFFYRLNILK